MIAALVIPEVVELIPSDDTERENLTSEAETESLISAPDTEPTDVDSDFDKDAKVKKARTKRVKETGGWRNYIAEFAIFLPLVLPRNTLKVKVCIGVSLFCMICRRVLNILIPLQLGAVTDQILAGEVPYRSLSIWLLLGVMDSDSGLGLINRLSRIPLREFSSQQVSNAAFAHVMSLDMEYHAEEDSAEMMKTIEQGAALSNLLETALLYILPTILDLIIAACFLYWKFGVIASLALVLASIGFISLEAFATSWTMPYRRRKTKFDREENRVMHQVGYILN